MTHNQTLAQARPAARWTTTLILLLFAALCAPTASAEAPPEETDALLKNAAEITVHVGKIRGLEALGPIKKGVQTREELRKTIVKLLSTEVSSADIIRDARILIRLGMLESGTEESYEKTVVDLLTEQIAGFYEHRSKQLFLVAGASMDEQHVIMAHELFHAIQDQHYKIHKIQPLASGLDGRRHNEDRALARSALIEGDATVLMLDYAQQALTGAPFGPQSIMDNAMIRGLLLQQLGNPQTAMSLLGQAPGTHNKVPAWMQESLLFPYFKGLAFVSQMRENASWDKLNKVYLAPPDSSEQILHPEKYLAGDAPQLVTIDTDKTIHALQASGHPWRLSHHNTLGEFQLYLWLKHHLSEQELKASEHLTAPTLAASAEGWDGDRLYSFEGGDGYPLTVLVSVWDRESDAGLFANALRAMTEKRTPGAPHEDAEGPHGGAWCYRNKTENTFIERWGSWVLFIDGLPATTKDGAPFPLEALRETLWQTRRTGPYTPHNP